MGAGTRSRLTRHTRSRRTPPILLALSLVRGPGARPTSSSATTTWSRTSTATPGPTSRARARRRPPYCSTGATDPSGRASTTRSPAGPKTSPRATSTATAATRWWSPSTTGRQVWRCCSATATAPSSGGAPAQHLRVRLADRGHGRPGQRRPPRRRGRPRDRLLHRSVRGGPDDHRADGQRRWHLPDRPRGRHRLTSDPDRRRRVRPQRGQGSGHRDLARPAPAAARGGRRDVRPAASGAADRPEPVHGGHRRRRRGPQPRLHPGRRGRRRPQRQQDGGPDRQRRRQLPRPAAAHRTRPERPPLPSGRRLQPRRLRRPCHQPGQRQLGPDSDPQRQWRRHVPGAGDVPVPPPKSSISASRSSPPSSTGTPRPTSRWGSWGRRPASRCC